MFEEFWIEFDLVFVDFFDGGREMYFHISLNPIIIFKFLAILATSPIQWSFQIVHCFDFDTFLGIVDLIFEDILHADEVNCVNFFLILIDLQLVEPVHANNHRVGEIPLVLIVVMKDLNEK